MMEGKFFSGLLGFVVIIALLGGLAFLGLSKTDLTNYNTSAAEARGSDYRQPGDFDGLRRVDHLRRPFFTFAVSNRHG